MKKYSLSELLKTSSEPSECIYCHKKYKNTFQDRPFIYANTCSKECYNYIKEIRRRQKNSRLSTKIYDKNTDKITLKDGDDKR